MKLGKCINDKTNGKPFGYLKYGKNYILYEDPNLNWAYCLSSQGKDAYDKRRFELIECNEKILNILYGNK